MSLLLAQAEQSFWTPFLRTLVFDAPHNTQVVLRGTMMLGAACGVVGAFLLLRKRSLVADALSHAALPGVCVGFLIATALGFNGRSLIALIPGAALFGLLGVLAVHLLTRLPRVKEDAAIGIVLSVFFALGVVLLGMIQKLPVATKAGLNHFIFGQAATMSAADATTIGITALLAMIICALMFKELRLICFDSRFAESLGWSSFLLDGMLLAMITALTVVGLSAVGAILMVALLIIPAAAARFWSDRLTVMIVLSAAIGAIACHVGTAASAVQTNLPTGPAIVLACGCLFIISMLAAPKRGLVAVAWQRHRLHRKVARQHLLRALYEHAEVMNDDDAVATEVDLSQRRTWSPAQLQRLTRRLIRAGEIDRVNGGFRLNERGRPPATRIVRTHRLWEHFLNTQADIAPSHVDRAADDIEHVLSDELIRELETDLRGRGTIEEGVFVPHSAHTLALSPASSSARS